MTPPGSSETDAAPIPADGPLAARAQPLHTVVLSDVHLCEAEAPDPRRPTWKRFKQRDRFIDGSFVRFLQHIGEIADGPAELVLNGDLFDFDSVTLLPSPTPFAVTWLERLRGLGPEEEKSVHKIRVILADHQVFTDGLRAFVIAGNRLVFVIGNHDLELHWPRVQAEVRTALDLPEDRGDDVRFCEWFFLSGHDTLIEHGNQFDDYCVCSDPVFPLVGPAEAPRIRVPFGNIANRLMLNGMGLFNPHVEDTFIRSVAEYADFFWRHVIRVQPLLPWTWFWSALATLALSLREGFLPALTDPLALEERVHDIARRANAPDRVARALLAVAVQPAIFNPWKVARELWLDRALLLFAAAWFSFQSMSTLNVFIEISPLWAILPFALLLAPFIFYARNVSSDIDGVERVIHKKVGLVAQIAGVRRVVLGHTHRERHTGIGEVELLNTGTWSAAYRDVECTEPYGRKCFAWIRPDKAGSARKAELREWKDPGSDVCVPEAPPRPRIPTVRRTKTGTRLPAVRGPDLPPGEG